MALHSNSRVLITGDSFIEGVGGSEGGWAQRLAREHGDVAIDIRGFGGHTSDDLVQRLAAELDAGPSLVIIGIGINDARWRPSIDSHDVPLTRFSRNIEMVAAAVAGIGARCFFVGLTSVDETLTSPYKPDKFHRNRDGARYDARLRTSASKTGASYVDGPDLAAVSDALSDGLHPSDIGHRLILDAVKTALRT